MTDVASVENDCGVCHANCSVAFQTSSQMQRLNAAPLRIDANPALYLTHYQDLPERPQWAALV